MEKSIYESTHEFFDMWLKTYDATYGKIIGMPAVGPMREKQEKMIKGIPIYANLYTAWIDSNVNFQTVFMEAMRKAVEKAMHDKEGIKLLGEQSKTLDESIQEQYKWFYNIWIESYSDTFKEFSKTGHFASDMGKFMSHFIDFQKYNREMTEETYLKPNNLPTKTNIEEIHKEIYDLKTKLKDLNGRISGLVENLEEMRENLEEIENSAAIKSSVEKKTETTKKEGTETKTENTNKEGLETKTENTTKEEAGAKKEDLDATRGETT